MKTVEQITDEWVIETQKIFAGVNPNSVFLNRTVAENIVNSLLFQPENLPNLASKIISTEKEIQYSPIYILQALDHLYEINSPLAELQTKCFYSFRDQLIQGWFNLTNSKTLSIHTQSENWENEITPPTPPDIYKILGDILDLLIQITDSDQAYLYLADFPYQTYNPFMVSGNLTESPK